MIRILGIIPARYQSLRFPGKVLVDIHGKSMVQRVYEQAEKAAGLTKVVVATDDNRIYDHVKQLGGHVCMTNTNHPSGTDRCFEALELEDNVYDFVINIQGDEPFIDPRQIEELINSLTSEVEIATQAKHIESQSKLNDVNCVKVVIGRRDNAIYFSRSPLPFLRNVPNDQWVVKFNYYQHIGIYAYRSDILKEITSLPQSPLEKAERLEQLRWLENGYTIKVGITEYQAHGIDTPEDLEKVLAEISKTA